MKKVTLWSSRSVPDAFGPSTSSSRPVKNTATVVSTTNGPSTRISGCGGPLRRYAAFAV